jgi:hypothetical protein
MSNVLAGIAILPIIFSISSGIVFAEIPTYNDEFDFNFTDIEVYRDSNNLQKLIIKPHVFFEGNEELGSVNIEVIVTDPKGDSYKPQIARINDIPIGTIDSTHWIHN